MLKIQLIVVGKIKETFFQQAVEEYQKRLGGYCTFTLTQLPEEKLKQNPSDKEISQALEKEGQNILAQIPKTARVIPLCVEGKSLDSPALAEEIGQAMAGSVGQLVLVIGGSFGLSPAVKQRGDLRLSMSAMTFPHHLARVMLMEQIYRGFKILENSPYHK